VGLLLPLEADAVNWSPFKTLSKQKFPVRQNENMGQAIVASGSDVHVVWYYTFSATHAAVYYIRSEDEGATWGDEVKLSPAGSSIVDGDPLLAVCGSYVHVVYWRNPYNTQGGIYNPPTQNYYRRSTDGGKTWEKEFLVANNYTFWPGLACSGNWVYINLNTDLNPSNSEVYFRSSSDNGGHWGNVKRITHANGRSEDPAMSAFGNSVYMAWNDNRATLGPLQLFYIYSKDNGVNWGPETAMSTAPSECYSPTVYASGSTVIALMRNSSQHIVRYLSTDGGLHFTIKPAYIETTAQLLGRTGYPSLTINRATNSAFVTYGEIENALHNYFQQSTDGGRTWSAPSTISTWPAPVAASGPTFISHGQGNKIHITWPLLTSADNGYPTLTYSSTTIKAATGRRRGAR